MQHHSSSPAEPQDPDGVMAAIADFGLSRALALGQVGAWQGLFWQCPGCISTTCNAAAQGPEYSFMWPPSWSACRHSQPHSCYNLTGCPMQSHLSTMRYGTVTHQPPELLVSGKLTPAADIYSFGIMSECQGWAQSGV